MHGREMLRAARYLFYRSIALGYFVAGTSRRDASTLNHYTITASRPLRRSSLGGLLDLLAPGLVGVLALRLCGTDTVAKLSPFTHETRRLSHGHIDGVAVA